MSVDLDSVKKFAEAAEKALEARQASQVAASKQELKAIWVPERATKEEKSTPSSKKEKKKRKKEEKNKLKDERSKKKDKKRKKRKKRRSSTSPSKGNKHKKRKKKHSSTSSSSSSSSSAVQDELVPSLVKPVVVTCMTGAAEARLRQSEATVGPVAKPDGWHRTRAVEIIAQRKLWELEHAAEIEEERSVQWRQQAEEKGRHILLAEKRPHAISGRIVDDAPMVSSQARMNQDEEAIAKAKAKFQAALVSFERSDDMFAGLD